jgi:hypothetical protein
MNIKYLLKTATAIAILALIAGPIALVTLKGDTKIANAFYQENSSSQFEYGGAGFNPYTNNNQFGIQCNFKQMRDFTGQCVPIKETPSYCIFNCETPTPQLPSYTEISPDACSKFLFVCSQGYTEGLTDTKCKSMYGDQFYFSNYECVTDPIPNFYENIFGNFFEQEAPVTDGNYFDFATPDDSNSYNNQVGSIESNQGLFPGVTIYDYEDEIWGDPKNLSLPVQEIEYDQGYQFS